MFTTYYYYEREEYQNTGVRNTFIRNICEYVIY